MNKHDDDENDPNVAGRSTKKTVARKLLGDTLKGAKEPEPPKREPPPWEDDETSSFSGRYGGYGQRSWFGGYRYGGVRHDDDAKREERRAEPVKRKDDGFSIHMPPLPKDLDRRHKKKLNKKAERENADLFKRQEARPWRKDVANNDALDDLWMPDGVRKANLLNVLPEDMPSYMLSLARGDVYPMNPGDFRFRLVYRYHDRFGQATRTLMQPDQDWFQAWSSFERLGGKGYKIVRLERLNSVYDTLTRRFLEIVDGDMEVWHAPDYARHLAKAKYGETIDEDGVVKEEKNDGV